MHSVEMYPNAPLVLTAFEVRHGATSPLTSADEREVGERLGSVLPLIRRVSTLGPPAQGSVPQALQAETAPRFMARDLTMAVTFRTSGLVVEASKYAGWAAFSEILHLALEMREQVLEKPTGIERIGLRYIDEIRVPGIEGESASAWRTWVDDSLLGPVQAGQDLGFTQGGSQGLVLFRTGSGTDLVLRYGAREGVAVEANGDLRRQTTSIGAFFLLDIDSFWTAMESVPEFSAKLIMELANSLHSPVRELFEHVITDKLRREVLQNG